MSLQKNKHWKVWTTLSNSSYTVTHIGWKLCLDHYQTTFSDCGKCSFFLHHLNVGPTFSHLEMIRFGNMCCSNVEMCFALIPQSRPISTPRCLSGAEIRISAFYFMMHKLPLDNRGIKSCVGVLETTNTLTDNVFFCLFHSEKPIHRS